MHFWFKKRVRRADSEPHNADGELRRWEELQRLFVNREDQLSALREATAQPHSVAVVAGPWGAGKSWLLMRHRTISQELRPSVYLCARDYRQPFELLTALIRELSALGDDYGHVAELLDSYEGLRATVYHELGQLAPRPDSIGRITPDIQGEIRQRTRSVLDSPEDVELVMNPEATLSIRIVNAVRASEQAMRPLIMLDDMTSTWTTSDWFRRLVNELSGTTPLVLVLDNATSLSIPGHIQIDVSSLEGHHARECVKGHLREFGEDPEPSKVAKICEFSAGLPLAIRWASEMAAQRKTEDFGDVQNDVLESLSQSLLEGLDASASTLAEALAIPRWIDNDLLERIGNKVRASQAAITAVRRLPFISVAAQGIAVQEEVRRMLADHIGTRNPTMWRAVQETCLEYHKSVASMPDDSAASRTAKTDSMVEWAYHSVSAQRRDMLTVVTNVCLTFLEYADFDACNRVLEDMSSTARSNPELAKATEYFHGEIAFRHGKSVVALPLLSAASEPSASDLPFYANAKITLGRLLTRQSAFSEATARLEEAVAHLQSPTSRHLQAYALEQLAKVQRMDGRLGSAADTHEKAATLSSSLGVEGAYAYASSLGSWGTTLMMHGDTLAGTDKLGQSIRKSREGGYDEFVCSGLRSRAVGLAVMGRLADALHDANEAYELADRLDDSYNLGFAEYVRAWITAVEVEPTDPPTSEWQSAFARLAECNAPHDLANAKMALAQRHLDWDNPEAARGLLDEARRILAGLRFKYGDCQLAVMESSCLLQEEQRDRALEQAENARVQAMEIEANRLALEARLLKLEAAVVGPSLVGREELSSELADIMASTSRSHKDLGAWACAVQLRFLVSQDSGDSDLTEVAKKAMTQAQDHGPHTVRQVESRLRAEFPDIDAIRCALDDCAHH